MMHAIQEENATQTMSKKQAAAFLGRSPRSISVYLEKGQLPGFHIRGSHGKELAFKVSDLERLKADMQAPIARGEVVTKAAMDTNAAPAHLHRVPSSAAMLQAQPMQQVTSLPQLLEDPVNRIVKALESLAVQPVQQPVHQPMQPQTATVPLAEKFVLSLEEARRLSGVAKDRLRSAIQTEDLAAFRDTLGRGWRIRREDLAAWVAGLQR